MKTRQDYFTQIASDQKETYDDWCKRMFFHPIGGALRLNGTGVEEFQKFFTGHLVNAIDVEHQRKSGDYIFLARFCRMPYYIAHTYIMFFDEEEAFLFKLCDGNVDNVKDIAPERLEE